MAKNLCNEAWNLMLYKTKRCRTDDCMIKGAAALLDELFA